MDVSSLGGEFKLIERFYKKPSRPEVIKSIGDDCAVFQQGEKKMVVTKDMLIEGDHFSKDYFSADEVGQKAAESNLSDVAAMGARPLYALIGLALPRDVTVEWCDRFYRGLTESFSRYRTDIIGGDTTHAGQIVVSVTLIGVLEGDKLCMRGDAKEGDVIKVTGPLGASYAGWQCYRRGLNGFEFVKKKHRRPSCRLDVSSQIAEYANAMQDISDGLGSEVRHMIRASGKGAVLDYDKIPVEKPVREAAEALGDDPVNFALYGGEDFELVYTVPVKYKDMVPGISVGVITDGEDLLLRRGNEAEKITRSGWDHFAGS